MSQILHSFISPEENKVLKISQLLTLVSPWVVNTGGAKKKILEFWELTYPWTKAFSHLFVLLDSRKDIFVYLQSCYVLLKWNDNFFLQNLLHLWVYGIFSLFSDCTIESKLDWKHGSMMKKGIQLFFLSEISIYLSWCFFFYMLMIS